MKSLLKVAWDKATVVPIRVQANPAHRILVVDDETDIRQLSTEVLIHSGYEVDTAADGAGWNQALNV